MNLLLYLISWSRKRKNTINSPLKIRYLTKNIEVTRSFHIFSTPYSRVSHKLIWEVRLRCNKPGCHTLFNLTTLCIWRTLCCFSLGACETCNCFKVSLTDIRIVFLLEIPIWTFLFEVEAWKLNILFYEKPLSKIESKLNNNLRLYFYLYSHFLFSPLLMVSHLGP